MNPFDPNKYLNSVVNAEMATTWATCPEGWWIFNITDIVFRGFKAKGSSEFADDRVWMDLKCESDDPNLDLAVGIKMKPKFSILVHTENDTIKLGPNTNLDLAQLRAAAGQNTPAPWSPPMLVGAKVKIHVTHWTPEGSTEAREQVRGFTAPYA